jgi:hypothetical protein
MYLKVSDGTDEAFELCKKAADTAAAHMVHFEAFTVFSDYCHFFDSHDSRWYPSICFFASGGWRIG